MWWNKHNSCLIIMFMLIYSCTSVYWYMVLLVVVKQLSAFPFKSGWLKSRRYLIRKLLYQVFNSLLWLVTIKEHRCNLYNFNEIHASICVKIIIFSFFTLQVHVGVVETELISYRWSRLIVVETSCEVNTIAKLIVMMLIQRINYKQW